MEAARAEEGLKIEPAMRLLGMSRSSYYRQVRGMTDYQPKRRQRVSIQHRDALKQVALKRPEAGHRKVRAYAVAWQHISAKQAGTSRMSCYTMASFPPRIAAAQLPRRLGVPVIKVSRGLSPPSHFPIRFRSSVIPRHSLALRAMPGAPKKRGAHLNSKEFRELRCAPFFRLAASFRMRGFAFEGWNLRAGLIGATGWEFGNIAGIADCKARDNAFL